ncbi:hypothetical protein GCM10025857_15520 [Alicyclobacillus contaminans]|uniref:hypothetical protein n=1 Tax=Alicyclobacillus contaminans TaxID=392016 RepID=UPI0003F61EB0|nr:hypothetical protein [Alicyclobacillus contaminans]GMA50195.1 hypothetical protein GCM10025857_15520 [Alicyclobacillus contaminans]
MNGESVLCDTVLGRVVLEVSESPSGSSSTMPSVRYETIVRALQASEASAANPAVFPSSLSQRLK